MFVSWLSKWRVRTNIQCPARPDEHERAARGRFLTAKKKADDRQVEDYAYGTTVESRQRTCVNVSLGSGRTAHPLHHTLAAAALSNRISRRNAPPAILIKSIVSVHRQPCPRPSAVLPGYWSLISAVLENICRLHVNLPEIASSYPSSVHASCYHFSNNFLDSSCVSVWLKKQ